MWFWIAVVLLIVVAINGAWDYVFAIIGIGLVVCFVGVLLLFGEAGQTILIMLTVFVLIGLDEMGMFDRKKPR